MAGAGVRALPTVPVSGIASAEGRGAERGRGAHTASIRPGQPRPELPPAPEALASQRPEPGP